ncbi:MAG: hypothetical protein GTO17_10400 [Candidatus Aminicenantes bacterium]|nr:hypothetical protein [Candidatus Aminicenantes bacterium]
MKHRSRMVFVFFLLLVLTFVAFDVRLLAKVKEESVSQSNMESLTDRVEKIFRKSCAISGCHKGRYPKMMLNLEPDKFRDSLINISSKEMSSIPLVNAEEPEKSYLLKKIRGEKGIVGGRMPLESLPLTEEQMKTVEDWVWSLKETAAGKERRILEKDEKAKPVFKRPGFGGTQLINLPTPQNIDKGEILFRISHRYFPDVGSGYDAFYGLDGPAVILLSLGYGISEKVMMTLGRSKLFQEVELSLKWIVLEQGKNANFPFSAALTAGGSWVTQSQPGRDVFQPENLKFNLQLSLSYQINDRLSFLLVPAYSSNTNHWESPSEGTLALGIGGRYMIFNDYSIIWEWLPVIDGYKDNSAGWGLGIEKKIGGHVFQVFILNSVGLTSDQFIPGGELRLKDGDFRIGFNIFRKF